MGLVGGLIRQLTVSLGKVIILVQDNSRIALITGENDDVGVGAESEVQIFLDLERLGCCGRVVGNLESKMLARMWEM